MKNLLGPLLVALTLVAAGCGGGSDDGADVGAPETATELSWEPTEPTEPTESPAETDGGGGAATETVAEEAFCSATDSGLVLEEQELPAPVAELRKQLFAAAGACDYDALAEIATASEGFTFTFGGGEGSPADFWRNQEEGATGEPMFSLQMVLSLPFTRNESGSYVWPSAHSPNATDEDWQALVDEAFYFTSDIEAMRESGTGYTGWRTAITAGGGQWQYFTEGD